MSVKNLELIRLKKIEIFGFKSFADRIELEFNQGITGIVGPNGCGKSNIADAFRWVLGEQSAKSMRGSKMPDVIFAGTTHRKPLNFAEVTITLCNECGLLPIDFAEVAVTRRLHRSGDSDYFINKNPVRMKDVQSLFMDLGKKYSIFEQGKIDQVIHYSPLERRTIFEEAAGISRFLMRKREALRKLEEADNNALRVKDIHREEEKQIALLEEQAEKAKIFKENKTTLEKLEKSYLVSKWDRYFKKKSDHLEKESREKISIEQFKSSLEEEIRLLSLAKSDLETKETIFKNASRDFFKAKNEKEIKSLEKKTNEERFKEIQLKQKSLKKDLEEILEKRKLRQNEFKITQEKQKLIQTEVSKEEQKLKAKRESLTHIDHEISILRDKLQRTQTEALSLMQKENQLESQLKENSVRLENAKEKKQEAESKKNRLQKVSEELRELIDEKKEELKNLIDQIDGKKNHFFELEEKLLSLTQSIKEKMTLIEKISLEESELKARKELLNRLKQEMEGFSLGSKEILKESQKEKSPLYQKVFALYELIKPKKGFEKSLAMVMRPYEETLVVKTDADFDDVIRFAEKKKLKDFSLVSLEKLKSSHERSSNQDFKFLNCVSKSDVATHFLNEIHIFENKDEALEFMVNQQTEILLKDSYFIDAKKVHFALSESVNNTFLREAEIETIENRLNEIFDVLNQNEKVLKFQEMEKQQFQSERIELDKSIRKEEMKIVEVNFGLQKLQTDLNKYLSEEKLISSEESSLNQVLTDLESKIIHLKEQHQEAKLKASGAHQLRDELQEVLSKKTTVYSEDLKQLQTEESSFQKITDENRKLIHSLNLFEVKDLESETLEKRLKDELESNVEMTHFIQSKGSGFDENLEILDKQLEEINLLCKKSEKEVLIGKQKIQESEKKLIDLQDKVKKLEKEAYQSVISLTESQSFMTTIEAEVQERYQMSIEKLKETVPKSDLTYEQMEKEIRLLKQKLEQSGDINMTSIEQLMKHQARYQFLNEQLGDLDQSKQELVQIISELDQESRKLFKETYDQIRENFQKNFKILFNGGEADLIFVESGDILEAGIDISAKPPGKQMRSISLLSGGEKCMTAMALLFAIFEVKPSPFCILDEIDAPLDDSNVERFVNVLKQFTDRCQFIIITHNKRTMSIADLLFGVSMEEKGVSKLLSIEFSKREKI